MRRMLGVLSLILIAATGCGRANAGPGDPGRELGPSTTGTVAPSPTGAVPTIERAAIYAAVLRRYLTTGDHSFGDTHRFPVAYVLERPDPNAAQPIGPPPGAAPLAPLPAAEQAQILAALADVGKVEFIADKDDVLVSVDRCAQVKNDGVMILLAPPVGKGTRVEVGIHGYVACLGATWFTYVVEQAAGGWAVTGTTGPMAIA